MSYAFFCHVSLPVLYFQVGVFRAIAPYWFRTVSKYFSLQPARRRLPLIPLSGSFFLPQQVEGQMTQDGEVRLGVALAQPAGVFTKTDVQDPMHTVLDPPDGYARPVEFAWPGRTDC